MIKSLKICFDILTNEREIQSISSYKIVNAIYKDLLIIEKELFLQKPKHPKVVGKRFKRLVIDGIEITLCRKYYYNALAKTFHFLLDEYLEIKKWKYLDKRTNDRIINKLIIDEKETYK